jgi:hypothetical protein
VALPALSEGRAFEQVTPVDKEQSIPEVGRTLHALGDGDRVAYGVRSAPGDAKGNTFANRFVSARSPSDWSHWVDADPVTGPDVFGFSQFLNMGTSEDGEYALVVSNLALAPGADTGRFVANLYVENIHAGTYEFVGSSNNPSALTGFTSGGQNTKFKAGSPNFSWVVFVSGVPLLPGVQAQALYRWSRSNGLELVSKLPDDSIPSALVANYGSASWASRWASRDGSRIFFEVAEGEDAGVYVWENGQTRPVSVSKLDGALKPGNFDDASADGRYVFLSTAAPLTADAPVSPSGEDLYRVDVVTGAIKVIGPVKSGATIGSRNSIEGTSPDGGVVYFQPPNPGNASTSGTIEVWDEGTLGVVADNFGDDGSRLGATISPSGRYLAYEFGGDVYVYDHANGGVKCASCRAGQATGQASLPGQGVEFDNYQPHVMLESGQVFFTSAAALVPQDVNGVEDVYSWQGGQQSLISPGNQTKRAILGDISPGGRDVFFSTSQSLVAQDTDEEVDIYDARVGGGIASQNQLPAVPCQSESCQSAIAPPAAPSIGSEGGANQAAAKKSKPKQQKKKSRCLKKKGKKGKAKCSKGKKHSKQGAKRRTSR